ncbi:salicylic acid-binding protein 2 [Dorcoceras hygrometricum]|uniref:Salicylic acid-binding protein 2 n=1 Tax=Dorcoceras hygrometricum TaxID=472368 RepID=A0A2Z7D4Q2_9LAMI|nr:salicylic acid-binding protein 2 [Dorcoceras hygrometricum]
MSASGIDQGSLLDDVRTFDDYTRPLLELIASIPQDEKVVLVGHSLGGLNIAVAMDKYPEKVSVAVFLAAAMPGPKHVPSYVLEKYLEQIPAEEWLDTRFSAIGTPEDPLTSDVALANMLLRPGSLFLEDLSKKSPLSEEGFGSVKRVNIVCLEDKAISVNFQHWQIENFGVDEVKEIASADHMAQRRRSAAAISVQQMVRNISISSGLVFMESAVELAMETSRVTSAVRNQLEHDNPAETITTS